MNDECSAALVGEEGEGREGVLHPVMLCYITLESPVE